MSYARCLCVLLFIPSISFAQNNPDNLPPGESDASNIEEILVTADVVTLLDGHRVDESEGAQLISADYIRAQQATTLADALRKTTSVQIDEQGGNQGSIVIIRGLSQDQVSVRVDGAPKNFNQVRHGGAGTIFAEPDMYRAIAVVPGVASNVYGSGSTGGMIQMETKDPADILDSDDSLALGARLGYESNGEAEYANLENAVAINEQWSTLLVVTRRESGSYEDGSGIETLGGATGSQDINLLGKVVYNSDEHSIEMSYLGLEKEYTARGAQSRGTIVSSVDQFTDLTEYTYSASWNYRPSDIKFIDTNFRYTRTSTERERLNDGATEPSFWETTTDYIEIENISTMRLFDSNAHELRYGIDWTYDDIVTAYSNAQGDPLLRERTALGGYLANSFQIGETLSALLSVRYDRFETKDVSSGRSLEESAVNPKVQLSWSPFEQTSLSGLSLVGVVGEGFRSPSVHEVFGRGDIGVVCAQGRRGFSCRETIPNADLKGEATESWEAGISYQKDGLFVEDDQVYVNVRYVNNDVDGFIQSVPLPDSQVEFNGRTYAVSTSTFENVAAAEIDGWEIFANYATSRWFASLTLQTLDGTDSDTGAPLRDVSPESLNASLGLYLFEGRARIGVDFTSRGDRIVDPTGEDPRFDRLGYDIFDLFASYAFSDRVSLRIRVENAADELYTKRYQNLSIDPATGAAQDLTYYQPGRNIKATLEMRL